MSAAPRSQSHGAAWGPSVVLPGALGPAQLCSLWPAETVNGAVLVSAQRWCSAVQVPARFVAGPCLSRCLSPPHPLDPFAPKSVRSLLKRFGFSMLELLDAQAMAARYLPHLMPWKDNP
jgi:hypothetical protein